MLILLACRVSTVAFIYSVNTVQLPDSLKDLVWNVHYVYYSTAWSFCNIPSNKEVLTCS